MRLLSLLFLSIPLVLSMSDGESILWNSHPYLVKILSTFDKETIACTGVIITPSAVLTSSECFKDVDENTVDALVLSPRKNGTNTWKRKVYGLKKSADFAMLSIRPRKSDELCPSVPALPRVARLPLSNSLLEPTWNPVDLDDIAKKKCRMIGFETVDQEDYVEDKTVLFSWISLEKDFDMMSAHVEGGKGACWDDIGVPVECELKHNEWTVVGLLHDLSKDSEEQDVPPEDHCTIVTGMRFSMFSDAQVGKLLRGINAEVLATFSKCFPDSEEEEEEKSEEKKDENKSLED